MLDIVHAIGLGIIMGCDTVLLIGFIYLSVAYGFPLAGINCKNPVGELAEEVAYFNPGTEFPNQLTGNATFDMRMLAISSELNCKEIRLAWVLAVALAVSFFISWMFAAGMLYKEKRYGQEGNSGNARRRGRDDYD